MIKVFLQHHQHLGILHNYLDDLKLFSDLYLAKFLDTSVKRFFPYKLCI